jgi:protein-disulfide isomerase
MISFFKDSFQPPMLPRSVAAAIAAIISTVACAQKPAAQAATLDTSKPAVADSGLVRADKARIQGSETAKVWLVMASDFQCPFCREFHDGPYQQILKTYVATGRVRVAYVNHPMAAHSHAVQAAEAAMCAGMQDKFWPMHDKLFATQDAWSPIASPAAMFDSLATSLQLQMPDWRSCVSTHRTLPMIEADNARTSRAGVDGTPSFFIDNKLAVIGAAPYDDFRVALDSALAHAGPPTGSDQRP